jgi:hypothetical protein
VTLHHRTHADLGQYDPFADDYLDDEIVDFGEWLIWDTDDITRSDMGWDYPVFHSGELAA